LTPTIRGSLASRAIVSTLISTTLRPGCCRRRSQARTVVDRLEMLVQPLLAGLVVIWRDHQRRVGAEFLGARVRLIASAVEFEPVRQ